MPPPEEYYIGFKNGDEKAFNYVYTRYYHPLCRHGRQIVDDEFEVSCIVHEAFLKGWRFRQVMENMRHIYCFIRLDVSWKCYRWLRNPVNRFHRCMVRMEAPEHYSNHIQEEREAAARFFDDERIKAIEEALPYLPANRQTILTLYFRHGLSYTKIARRFGLSGQAINSEVRKTLESLRQVVHAQKRLSCNITHVSINEETGTEVMDMEMQQVFRLRYEQKHSFAAIAQKMNLSQGYVQQQYALAHRRLRQLYQK